jgi:hypothetical protein
MPTAFEVDAGGRVAMVKSDGAVLRIKSKCQIAGSLARLRCRSQIGFSGPRFCVHGRACGQRGAKLRDRHALRAGAAT